MPTITLTLPVAGNGITAGLHATNYADLQALLNGGLDADNLAALAVTEAKIAAGAVTATKLSLPYSTYVPELTATTVNPTYGASPTKSGQYIQIGKFVHCFGHINVGGAGFAAGTGDYRISLPVTASVPIANAKIGTARLVDASAVALALPQCQVISGGLTLGMSYPAAWPSGASTQVGAAAPWVWAQGDDLFWDISYRAA